MRSRAALVVGSTAALFGLTGVASAFSTNFTEHPLSPVPVGDNVSQIAAADLDGDNDIDLVAPSNSDGNVGLFQNDGTGTLAEMLTSPEPVAGGGAAVQPLGASAADFDGDGDQDIATANLGGESVSILVNDGNGDMTERASSPESLPAEAAVPAAGDFDGDADVDLAVTLAFSDQVAILENNGSGNLGPPAIVAAGDQPIDILAADLDGDGDLDLVAANGTGQSLTVLRNRGNGSGNFVEHPRSPVVLGHNVGSIDAGDIDGDLDQDVVAGQTSGAFAATVLKNNGTGRLRETASSPEQDGPHVTLADFDGDGDLDLAAPGFNQDAHIFRNNGNGNFTEAPTSPEALSGGETYDAFGVVIDADLDGDTDPDLVINRADTSGLPTVHNAVSILLNNGS